ncbi:MAG TPA: hemerythrin domain-containing protein [Chitinophagaceae bacterium]|nr:hemerythrin domain-containing protein [Chitinophagaceae bacterium]
MQRFNPFNLIHKGLRALLYDTALQLQQTCFADPKEAASAIGRVRLVVQQFEQHAALEDAYVLPAIAAYEPALVDAFEQEHEHDEALGRKLVQLLLMFEAVEEAEARVLCGSAINKAFRDFLVFNLEHMGREETVLNAVLWNYYTDAEIQQLNARVQASLPETEKAAAARWMMRGINKTEATRWLTTVRQQAPAPVFEQLLRLSETELPAGFRAKVQAEVCA